MNTHLRTVCIAVAVFAWLTDSASTSAADKDLREQATRLAKPFIDADYAQAMSIGLIKGDDRVIVHLGRVRGGDDAAPDDATLYEIGSVSKTFTALLLADEVTRGNLSLDTPLANLLPEDVTVPAGKERAITLADLATHTSGLVRMPTNFKPGDKLDPYADYTLDQLYEFISGTKLHSEPGKLYAYSNVGTTILGHALALHAKKDFGTLLRERILKPLKMNDTATALSEDQQKRFAEAYADGRAVKAWNLNVFDPAGGIRSNVVDMMHYVEAQLGKRQSSLDKAIELSHQHLRDIPVGGIGLGWHIARDKATRWHNGQTGGFHAYVGFHRKLDVGVIVLASSDNHQIDRLGEQLVRMLAGRDEKPIEFPKVVKVDRKVLEKYVGTFAVLPTFQLKIELAGDRLRVTPTGQATYSIYPESETRFNFRVTKATIVFEVADDGSVSKLMLLQNGLELPAVRLKVDGK